MQQHFTTDYAIKEVDEESNVVIGTPPKRSSRNSITSNKSGERHSLNASLDKRKSHTPSHQLVEKINSEPKNPLVQIEIAPNDSYWG